METIPHTEKEPSLWKSSTYYYKLPQALIQKLNLRSSDKDYSEIERILTQEQSTLGKERGDEVRVDLYQVKPYDLFPELKEEGENWFEYKAVLERAAEHGLEPLPLTTAFEVFLQCNENRTMKWEKGEKIIVPTKELVKSGDIAAVLDFKSYNGHELGYSFSPVGDTFSIGGPTRLLFQKKA